MAGHIWDDPDRAVDGTEKVAAQTATGDFGILISSIASYIAAATMTLIGKTIDAASNTISNLTTAMFAANVIDTDTTLAANSDTRIASQKAVKAYADARIAAQDAMVFKGVTDCSGNPNYPAADRGHTYRVSVAGKIGGASGAVVEAGDMFICLTDGTASGNQATVGAQWSIIQTNIDGAVTGPASSTSGNIATFNGSTGKVVQDSGLPVSTLTGAWTVSTPTVTASSNTFTTVSCSLRYKLIGKTAIFTATVTITNAGTAAGNILFDLPFTPTTTHAGGGKEVASLGHQCNWQTIGSQVAIAKYDNTTIIATGRTVVITGTIETT
ncbi:hypothetical protein AB7G19_29935 [Bradyrhizobium sp. 215_C5_N1_1]|uniref:hypothetical protein n=1 Tax=unclassified Bradyrhizobium TaxID=2631580 RepID=UPI003F8B0F77